MSEETRSENVLCAACDNTIPAIVHKLPDGTNVCTCCSKMFDINVRSDDLLELDYRPLLWYMAKYNISVNGLYLKQHLTYEIEQYHAVLSNQDDFNDAIVELSDFQSESPVLCSFPGARQDCAIQVNLYSLLSTLTLSGQNEAIVQTEKYEQASRLSKECQPVNQVSEYNEQNPMDDHFLTFEQIPFEKDCDSLSDAQLVYLLESHDVEVEDHFTRVDLVIRAKSLWVYHKENASLMLKIGNSRSTPGNRNYQIGSSNEEEGNDDDDDKATDSSGECIICRSNSSNCVFVECGHLICCLGCGVKLSTCPFCKRTIKRHLRVYRC